MAEAGIRVAHVDEKEKRSPSKGRGFKFCVKTPWEGLSIHVTASPAGSSSVVLMTSMSKPSTMTISSLYTPEVWKATQL